MTTIYYKISLDPIVISVAKIVERLTTERYPKVVLDFYSTGVVRHDRYITTESALNMLKGNKQDAIKNFLRIQK